MVELELVPYWVTEQVKALAIGAPAITVLEVGFPGNQKVPVTEFSDRWKLLVIRGVAVDQEFCA